MAHPRSRARELALQYLYMHDLLNGEGVQPLSDYLGMQQPEPDRETAELARKLVTAVVEHKGELDEEIAAAARNWTIQRMAFVDRNILRLGIAEMIACAETPYRVIINEAVELARRYSSESACGFVNGLLDKIRPNHRADETSPGTN